MIANEPSGRNWMMEEGAAGAGSFCRQETMKSTPVEMRGEMRAKRVGVGCPEILAEEETMGLPKARQRAWEKGSRVTRMPSERLEGRSCGARFLA